MLENRGYTVDVAVDGVDGWNAVRSAHYDLVVSDIDMPRMDGIQLVQHIKEDARLKAIPVVIVSYKDREEDRIRGLDAGANFYLTKSSFHDQTFLDNRGRPDRRAAGVIVSGVQLTMETRWPDKSACVIVVSHLQ